jgi:negative regulator of flagellin synthesis FlgM
MGEKFDGDHFSLKFFFPTPILYSIKQIGGRSTMRIDDRTQPLAVPVVGNERVDQAGDSQRKAAETAQKSATASDRLDISSTADRLHKVSSVSQELTVFRADRVAELKGKIESGQYSVNSKAVAEKMFAAYQKGFKA